MEQNEPSLSTTPMPVLPSSTVDTWAHRFLASVAILLAVGVAGTLVGAIISHQADLNRTDPREGTVIIKDEDGQPTGFTKRCEGTTLLVFAPQPFGTKPVQQTAGSPDCQP